MPSLVVFGRRWNLGSDDFVFPQITEAIVRLIWIAAAIGLFMLHNPSQCKSLEWLVYLSLLVIGNIITIVLCIAIAVESAKGSILEVSARRNVVKLIYCRVPLFIAEIIYTVLSAIFAFGLLEIDACFSLISLRITVVLEVFLICCVFFGIIIVFNTHGSQSVERSFLVERQYWKTRMILCKIRQSSEMRSALDEIASLLASFFSDTDYVASDLLAGLLLLVHSPEQPPAIEMLLNEETNYPDWMKLPNSMNMICHMLNFAVAIYGWPSYLINNFSCSSWCQLIKKTKSCCCRKPSESIVDDNCWACSTTSFLLESNINEEDLFYVSFRNKLYQTPFIVLADHQTQSIIITIRGSASILDFVTDLSLNEEVFSIDVDNDPILCQDQELDAEGAVRVHRGMLRSAHYVYNTLKKNRVLEEAKILHPSYKLIITGHSLGAGVASLLTLLLKQTYPDIKCFAFSPPTCISEHGIEETEEHILSIIVGDDIIPRISYQSMMRLKNQIDEEIASTTRAKYEILIKGIFKLFFSAPWDIHSDNISSADNRSCRRLLNSNETYGARADDNVSIQVMPPESVIQRVRLYVPGKLLHFSFDPTTKDSTANWIKHDYLKDIQLTGSILADHMPKRVKRLLRQARDQHVVI